MARRRDLSMSKDTPDPMRAKVGFAACLSPTISCLSLYLSTSQCMVFLPCMHSFRSLRQVGYWGFGWIHQCIYLYLSALLPLKDPNLPKDAERNLFKDLQALQHHFLSGIACRTGDGPVKWENSWMCFDSFGHGNSRIFSLWCYIQSDDFYLVDLREGTKIKGVPPTKKVLLALTWFSHTVPWRCHLVLFVSMMDSEQSLLTAE